LRLKGVSAARLALELVVVVMGVLIALAVDQAVDAQGERRLSMEYLRSLRDDVQADVDRLEGELIPGIESREQAARDVVSVIEGAEVGDARGLAVSLDWAGHLTLFEPQRATFDDLVATGNLRLLPNTIRGAASSYYELTRLRSMHEVMREEIWYVYRRQINKVLDPLLMAELTRVERLVERGRSALIAGLDSASFVAGIDPTALRHNPEFRAGIGTSIEYTLIQREMYVQRADWAKALLEDIEGALAGASPR
jgi:hypothetical protein